MGWEATLITTLLLLMAAFLTGAPLFVAFLVINLAGVAIFLGPAAFGMVANSIFDTANYADLATIPLFVLMAEILFRSGSVDILFDAVDKLVGRMKGRQYVLTISLSTVFGALSGSGMAVAAMLARTLFPTMRNRGYDTKLSIGTMLAGASLAPIIPPSVLAIVIGTLSNTSIAGLLIGGIIPGLLLAGLFLLYTMVRVKLNPELAPDDADDVIERVPTAEKLRAVASCLPFGLIIFSVMGFIMFGIATPSEAAATGVLASLITAAYYRRLNFSMIVESLGTSAFITSMILLIMASSRMFSQLLAFSGATTELTNLIVSLDWSPMLMLFIMMLIPFILCMFIDQIALMLVVIPIYQPLLSTLGFDPVWFWLIMLLNVTVGGISPPFGYVIFAFQGAADKVTISEAFNAAWPFVALFLLGMVALAVFPPLVTFLPSLL
ncbi:MAG: TRAP transporter large permease [Pseudomonadota bacterium]|nr:C4-dicarboxylate ABC transporter permease [Alphaproteobacteria bacterium]MEC7464796.1 TRAP transporter large permease [Pseudomonadota bacterium]MEC7944426.1 TRAP transporter large permease [Pseudomonadota bacterium]MEC8531814.1 TRAP transporter large permease [Pseudomonadota bacterium]MEC8724869.1 TRAP transporter large permease [Pseudomonadota bacterium]